MRTLVVYESMFGNTAEVAGAVSEGMAHEMDVDLHEVSDAPAAVTGFVDLIVLGGPTHAFSLSRPGTRAAPGAREKSCGRMSAEREIDRPGASSAASTSYAAEPWKTASSASVGTGPPTWSGVEAWICSRCSGVRISRAGFSCSRLMTQPRAPSAS